jgi:integrase
LFSPTTKLKKLQTVEAKKPYDRFIDAVENPNTRHEYASSLRLFMEYYKVTEYEELLKLTTEEAEDMVIQYILSMKKKGLSEGLITQRAAAIRKFFSSNRVNLNWDFINQHKGKFKKKQKLEAYSHEQIEKLLQVCDLRTRCIVLIFSSTGIRIGALPELRKKHLKRIGDLYQFTVYEGYDEEYVTFCTPECAIAIDSYLAYRERSGEVITEESYLIVRDFDSEDIRQTNLPVSSSTIRNIMSKRMIKAGLRKLEHGVDTTHRKQIPIDHGFRMFFTSQLVNSKLQPELRWLLEGHALKANDKSYVRVKDQLYDQYIKAINNLTINPENRLKEQVKSLEADRDEITLMKLEHRQEIKKMMEEREEDKNRVDNLTSVVQTIFLNMNNMNQESKNKLAKSMIESGIFK